MKIGRIIHYLLGKLKRDPELRFVEKRGPDGRLVWTLVNTGAATPGDVLVAEFGEKNRVLNYINIGPVAAFTEVTLPREDFRYCIALEAAYCTRRGSQVLHCSWYKNVVCPGVTPGVQQDCMPAEAFPRITRKSLLLA